MFGVITETVRTNVTTRKNITSMLDGDIGLLKLSPSKNSLLSPFDEAKKICIKEHNK